MTGTRGPDPEAMNPEERRLAIVVDGLLRDVAGIYAAVRVGKGVAYLDGVVDSVEQRQAAGDLAATVGGIVRVQNDLDVEEFGQPGQRARTDEIVRADASYQMLEGDLVSNPDPLRELSEPDYNEPIPVIGGDMTSNSLIAVEE